MLFFVLSKVAKDTEREKERERWRGKGGRGGPETRTTLIIFFLVKKSKKKKRSNARERATCSLASGPKKQSLGKKNETREEEARRSHFTRATNNFIIMALRQTLKQFTSKTTAFAPLLSRASGVQMYSTVIEGLKYASSHEWYVITNSFSISVSGELSLLCCSGTHFFCFLSLYPFYPFVTYTFHMHIA